MSSSVFAHLGSKDKIVVNEFQRTFVDVSKTSSMFAKKFCEFCISILILSFINLRD